MECSVVASVEGRGLDLIRAHCGTQHNLQLFGGERLPGMGTGQRGCQGVDLTSVGDGPGPGLGQQAPDPRRNLAQAGLLVRGPRLASPPLR